MSVRASGEKTVKVKCTDPSRMFSILEVKVVDADLDTMSFCLCFRDIGYRQTGNSFQYNYMPKSLGYCLNRINI